MDKSIVAKDDNSLRTNNTKIHSFGALLLTKL